MERFLPLLIAHAVNLSRAKLSRGDLSIGRVVHGVSCHAAGCHGSDFQGESCHGTGCHGASSSWLVVMRWVVVQLVDKGQVIIRKIVMGPIVIGRVFEILYSWIIYCCQ